MPIPIIRPIEPEDSASFNHSIHGQSIFVLDDQDSSIDLDSIFASGFYGDISIEDIKTVSDIKIANFNDTGPNPIVSNNIDKALSGGQITLSVPSNHGSFNNCVLIKAEKSSQDGFCFSFKVDIPSSSLAGTGSIEYLPEASFTGVAIGAYDFRTKVGITLFYMAPSTIKIAGPSQDGVGTRASVSVSYNWSNESIYTLFVDYTNQKVTVTVNQNESDDDTVLVSESLSFFGLCLDSCSFFGEVADSSESLFSFFSENGRSLGDTLVISDYCLFPKAIPFVYEGYPTKKVQDFLLKTTDSYVEKTSLDDFKKFNVSLETAASFTKINFSLLSSYMKINTKSLLSEKFAFQATMFIEPLNNLLDIDYAGVEVRVSTLTNIIRLSFLDNAIGVLKNSSTDHKRKTSYAYTSIDTTVPFTFLLLGDGSNVFFYLIESGKYSLKFQVAYSDLPSTSLEEGFYLYSSDSVSPQVFIKNFFAFGGNNVGTFLSTYNGTSVSASSNSYSHNVPSVVNNTVEFVGEQNKISGAYFRATSFSPVDSGVSIYAKFKIEENTPIPINAEMGPFIIANTANNGRSIQLCSVRATDGVKYFYLPGDYQDYEEVAYQTNKGKSISFQLKENSEGFYCCILRVAPRNGIYVYDANDEFNTAIKIAKDDMEGSTRLLPDPYSHGIFLPTDVQADTHFCTALGVLNTLDFSVTLVVESFLFSTGRGVSVSFFLKNIGLDSYYGNRSRMLVSAEDND